MSTARTRKAARRSTDHLLPTEVGRLLAAARETGRHGHRNYTLMLLAYRHGLRLGEVSDLRWRMFDLKRKILRVPHRSRTLDSVHPLHRDELAALRKLKRDYPGSSHLFVTDRGTQLSQRNISRIVASAGRNARLRIHVSPKMLRHSCGYALARAGQNPLAIQHYLGYQDPRYVLRYLELPPKPFKDFWKDLEIAG